MELLSLVVALVAAALAFAGAILLLLATAWRFAQTSSAPGRDARPRCLASAGAGCVVLCVLLFRSFDDIDRLVRERELERAAPLVAGMEGFRA